MAQQPYIELADLKSYLSIASSDTSKDNVLTLLITSVQGFVERHTSRSFGWGDKGDVESTDYSNSQNIGVTSLTMSGNTATIGFMGVVPWVAGQAVTLVGFTPAGLNGNFTVSTVSATQYIPGNPTAQFITLDIGSNPGNATVLGRVISNVQNYAVVNQESHDGLIGKIFFLRNSDIRSVDSVFIGLRNLAQPVQLDPTQYVWRDDGRVILGGAYFNSYNSSIYADANDNAFYGTVASGYQTILVNYHYGYIGVPGDIALAMLDVISALYNLRAAQGLQEEKTGNYTLRYDINIRKLLQDNPDTLSILNKYRRRRIT